ncbi:MAG: hypothetical protein ACXIUL_08595 [Wenzhouxiangella sp.]
MFEQVGSIPVQRLSETLGQSCGQDLPGPWRAAAALSGSWFDPERNGEGFAFQVLESGQAVMAWLGFDDQSRPIWAFGTGPQTGPGTFSIALQVTRGGGFAGDFDPEQVERLDWAEARLGLSCLDGSLQLAGESLAKGSNSDLNLKRLTLLAGSDCPLPLTATAPLEQAAWDRRFTVPGLAGSNNIAPQVLDMAVAEDGRVLVAGDFSWAGRRMVPGLVTGDIQGNDWQPYPALVAEPVSSVTALASAPGKPLAMAVSVGNRGRILLDHGDQVEEIGEFFSRVHRLAWHDGALWAAGSYRFVGESDWLSIAFWDGSEWQRPSEGGPNGQAWALLSSDEGLFVAGAFDDLDGQPVSSLIRWDGSGWHDYGLDGEVFALDLYEQQLIAAGSFGGQADHEGLVRWTGSDWQPLGGGVHAEGASRARVSDTAVFDGKLYAAGCFDSVQAAPDQSGSISVRGLAAWDGQVWRAVAAGESRLASVFQYATIGFSCGSTPLEMPFQRLLGTDHGLYIGSRLPGLDGVPSQSLIAFDGQQLLAMEHQDSALGLFGEGRIIGKGPDGLYVSGPSHFGNQAAGRPSLARLDRMKGWAIIDHPLPAKMECRPHILDQAGRVLAACTSYRDDPAYPMLSSPALWRYSVWQLTPDGWREWVSEEPALRVLDMALAEDGAVWLVGGGGGDYAGGFLARVRDGEVEIVEGGFDALVNRVAVSAGQVLVAGGFGEISGQPHDFAALYRDQAWQRLPPLDGLPSAIAVRAGEVHVSAMPSGGPVLGAWDEARDEWVELATEANDFPAEPGTVNFSQLVWAGERLFAVGPEFTSGSPAELVVFENGRFERLGGGFGVTAGSLVVDQSAVYLGGAIVETDPDGEPVASVGIARLHWD